MLHIASVMESAGESEWRAEAITYAPSLRFFTDACRDFKFKYSNLLNILMDGITDDFIQRIIALVSVLKVHLPNVAICTKQEKQSINSGYKSDAARARKAATSYINKKDEEINQLVKEVQAAQEAIKNANAALAASGQSTIPANTLPDSVRPTHSSHSTQTGRPRPPISTGRPPYQTGTGRPRPPMSTGRPRPPMTTGRPLMTTRPSKFMI